MLWILIPPRPRPLSFRGDETLFQLTRWLILLPAWPSQKKFHMILSKEAATLSGIENKDR